MITYPRRKHRHLGLGAAVISFALLAACPWVSTANAETAPSSPVSVTTTRADGAVVVKWRAPETDGGSPITGYVVNLSGSGLNRRVEVSSGARSTRISGLVNGRSYLVTVVAKTLVGNSIESVAIRTIPSTRPADVPEEPIILSSSVASQSATISFSLGNNNGSTITLVEYSTDAGRRWVTALSNPIPITNLTNGTNYTVLLRAKNSVGFSGAASRAVKPIGFANVITFTQPAAMTTASADQPLSASATGGITSFTSLTPEICTVVAGKLHAIALGTCKVVARSLGDATYAAAAQVSRSVSISPRSMTITVPAMGSLGMDSADRQVQATAPGGTTVIKSSSPAVCTIVKGKIHPVSMGTCRVVFSNAGDKVYGAAADVERAFMVVEFSPTIVATPTSTPTNTTTPTADPTPTSTTTAVPSIAYIRLTDADKATMTDKSLWWTNEPESRSWVKFVSAGDALTLHYRVTTKAGEVVVGANVIMRVKAGGATFIGGTTAVTNELGIATFQFQNDTDPVDAEPRPESPSSMNYWDPTYSVSPEVKYDFTPTIGARNEHIDRVWTHTVRPEGWTPPALEKTLLWSDEFSGDAGTSPSAANWNMTVGDGCQAPDNNCGWGNGEQQWYTASANKLDGSSQGNLTITASRSVDSQHCYYGTCSWKSGKITTYGKVNFTYGYLEVRAKTPSASGAWPAFWMLGSDIYSNAWPGCGEIDILEVLNSAQYMNWGTAHWADSYGAHVQGPDQNTVTFGTKLADDYHTYGILWKPGQITWYIDSIPKYTLTASKYSGTRWPFGKSSTDTPKFYAILNVAMGGQGGTPSNSTNSTSMSVDYVRYYSVDGLGTVNSK